MVNDPLADFTVWTFETFLEPAENLPNIAFTLLGFVGLFYWLNLQAKYNKKAEQESNQLK
jgi:hypothetical protein